MQRAATACLTILVFGPLGCAVMTPQARTSASAPAFDEPMARKSTAPLFNDLGDHHHPITTRSPKAQRYFDQGLTLAYGFNHAEAIRSFREALRLDPDCAMCAWGIAVAYGPNINASMGEEAVLPAYEALTKGLELAPNASEAERAYIQALSKRYAAEPSDVIHAVGAL